MHDATSHISDHPRAPSQLQEGGQSAGMKSVTPMMAQYLDIKQSHKDALLFYRMGDFYELFFEDAEKASHALGITLTKRGKHLDEDIPMCGVPVHAADGYLERLIRSGFKVAVAEQTENPQEAKKRGAKAVVRREVVRLVTPGTLTEDTLLDSRRHNFLAALGYVRGRSGEGSGGLDLSLAWADISTGDFYVESLTALDLAAELARLSPGEVLVPEPLMEETSVAAVLEEQGAAVTRLPRMAFDSGAGERRLKEIFYVKALEGFGAFSRADVSACGALVDYVMLTQVGQAPALKPPRRESKSVHMSIDAATQTNLELVSTLTGERKGSLLSVIDKTLTGAGARALHGRLTAPLTDLGHICARHDAVAFFVAEAALREDARTALKGIPDIARALSRLRLNRGGPRDLAAIRDGLRGAGTLRWRLSLSGPSWEEARGEVAGAIAALGTHHTLIEKLTAALSPDLPLAARDGGFIAPGFHGALDEVRRLRDESRQIIAGLQARYADMAGIKTLKVRHNNVLGYFIDVSAQAAPSLMAPPLSDSFIHRQTLANNVRFTTVELSELDTKIARARDQALAMEQDLFAELVALVLAQADEIAQAAAALGIIDVAAGLAELAQERRYVRPEMDESQVLTIKAGRHPVVEAALETSGDLSFVANDTSLNEDSILDEDASSSAPSLKRLWLVTGPNMAGKSTFLRQNALIVILAQMGGFVPARAARIGIVDRVFSRVGAADDLARGRSTFMVEMVETAAILNQAGPRSLVILDEVGRGTATFDGLSIAWAAVEHLHEVNRCRALFATHYHELTALTQKLNAVANVTMSVKEWEGEVVFLHEVKAGAADRSYGIQVAKLAGLPPAVIARAREVLAVLERTRREGGAPGVKGITDLEDLPLFSKPKQKNAASPQVSELEKAVDGVHVDDLTPRQALEFVYHLKALQDR